MDAPGDLPGDTRGSPRGIPGGAPTGKAQGTAKGTPQETPWCAVWGLPDTQPPLYMYQFLMPDGFQSKTFSFERFWDPQILQNQWML